MNDEGMKFDEARKERIEAKWCIDSEDANVEYLIDLKTSKVLMVRNRNDKQ
ncbi:MAG TPA: hypothetical protein VNX68_03205 [Nitrosopumilaceae archaeon]|nr:hypothetical protein [Nitrosopumilaceae archaeon]